MLKRFQVVMTGLLLLGVIFLAWRLSVIASDQQAVLERLDSMQQSLTAPQNAATGTRAPPTDREVRLAGATTDTSSNPLPGVSFNGTLKTWGYRGYEQWPFQCISDELGAIVHTERHEGSDYAVHLTAHKLSYAFVSLYHERRAAEEACPDTAAVLPRSAPVRVIVLRQDGSPLRHGVVTPAQRTTRAGETHLVYHQGVLQSNGMSVELSDKGQAWLHWFEEGDRATLRVLPVNGAWQEVEFDVVTGEGSIELVLPSA